jgi:hypothetical protein
VVARATRAATTFAQVLGWTQASNLREVLAPIRERTQTDDAAGGAIVGQKFDIAYANRNQPIQSSDWWNGAGLQFQGCFESIKRSAIRTYHRDTSASGS